jgi:hypothetical protein
MLVGAAVNALGIRNPKRPAEGEPRPEEPAGVVAKRVDTIPEGVPCLPVAQPTGLPGDPRMHTEEP